MRETADDFGNLQRTLDDCYAEAGVHLRSVFRPERRMTAQQVAEELRGVFVLHVATVTATCEPRVAPVDGLFFRGRFWFGFPPGAVRIAHLRARPQVSVTYTRGEDVCVLVHGNAREVAEHSDAYAEYEDYAREAYTPAVWDYWRRHYDDRAGRGLTASVEPMKLFAMKRAPEPR